MSPLLYCTCVFLLGFTLFSQARGSDECDCACPDGWVRYKDACYLFGHGYGMPFYQAEHYCSTLKAHLLMIDSSEENAFIKDYLFRLKAVNYWLSLTDETVLSLWRWYITNEMVTFTDWGTNEPTNTADQQCGAYSPVDKFQWADIACHIYAQPICKRIMTHQNEIIIG